MSKIFIFGIGGTGSRVLRSLTMILATGVKFGADEIVPIIIDPDAANADLTRTVSLLNNYSEIRENLQFNTDNKNRFFRTEIERILPNYTLRINDTDDKSFQQFIEYASMSKSNKALTKMLFSDKNLESSMEVGFKGNPNIGSVVLNQIAHSDDFLDFANSFSDGDRIFIISSIFGGTGASGFPLLLKTLREGNNFPNYDLINRATIGAVTILPYFKLKQDDESEIDSSTFISKTKSALAYYENNISKNNTIDALYYLADDVTNTYENHEGGSAQQNAAHLIEFLGATSIVDFSNSEEELYRMKSMTSTASVIKPIPASEAPTTKIQSVKTGYFGTVISGEGGTGYFKKMLEYKDGDARFLVKSSETTTEFEPIATLPMIKSSDYMELAVEFNGCSKSEAMNMTLDRPGIVEQLGDKWIVKQKALVTLTK